MNSWVRVLSLDSLAHHRGGSEGEGGGVCHCLLGHRLDRRIIIAQVEILLRSPLQEEAVPEPQPGWTAVEGGEVPRRLGGA